MYQLRIKAQVEVIEMVNREIYALLTKREVNMAGYWAETKSSSIKTKKKKKKERGKYPIPVISTEQAWSIKDILNGQKITPKNFAFAGTIVTKRTIPSAGKIGPSCPLG